MIYGLITNDPEYGEECVAYFYNSLKELILNTKDFIEEFDTYAKCAKYKNVDEIVSDEHKYYPEFEPFLWDTEDWEVIDNKTIKKEKTKLKYYESTSN